MPCAQISQSLDFHCGVRNVSPSSPPESSKVNVDELLLLANLGHVGNASNSSTNMVSSQIVWPFSGLEHSTS